MAKDHGKPGPRARPAQMRASGRRTTLRRQRAHPGALARAAIRSPVFGYAAMTAAIFALVATALTVWAREQPLIALGRVMNETRVVRLPFRSLDEAATKDAREKAAQEAPRVYVEQGALQAAIDELRSLPGAVAGAETLEAVAPEIRRKFSLDEPLLASLKRYAPGAAGAERWDEAISRLARELRRNPMVSRDAYQVEANQTFRRILEVRTSPDGVQTIEKTTGASPLINAADSRHARASLLVVSGQAGVPDELQRVVAARLISDPPSPLFRVDETATAERQAQAEAAVEPAYREEPANKPIYTRGEKLTASQLELCLEERDRYLEAAPAWEIWLQRLGVLAVVSALTLAASVYLAMFSERVRRNPQRMVGIAVTLGAALVVACVGSVMEPRLLTHFGVAPSVFVAVILVIAYDQRIALAISALHAALVCVALDQSIVFFSLIVMGCGVAIWQLAEIRDRRTLISMAGATGAALAVGAALASLVERPLGSGALLEILWDAGFAGAGGLLVGGVTLFILPWIERLFDITTGMTLIELRDPKQPLLRELQQRAPGTYNHSLNVASIAEQAADAIGARALLTYVGSLYHDIGKMNKPEYFVENQSGGPNKHDKLSPAMSLLVIVGHVKDGLELAREFGLPRSIQHFIDAHHGTTLVEYFYERARKRAREQMEADTGPAEAPEPQEIEYRYPGPKPQTKEVAILMLADSVESATRTMADPTPSRIDALVRSLANKRLMDGQFDECDLTLRELETVSESISKSVASIYHGRIVYPSKDEARRA